jgi:hypothetical protein
MWLVFARAPLPDARHWPGRRLLALVDAVAWPMVWIALALHLQQAAGVVAPVVAGLAVLAAVGRLRRAAWQNHRYHFTTWCWARLAAGVLVLGLVLRTALQA